MSDVVTRFAPSPTGSLHVGGLRTAMYNFVYARKMGGKFILRIEDTDEVRSTDDSLKGIVRDLKWAGITWDEGPSLNPDDIRNNQIGDNGPYFQSQRKDIYNKFIDKLIGMGMAYEKDGAILFSMPKEDIIVKDVILGDVRFPASQCQDLVIRKSTGMPTFHFAVVIDDATMGVTHVIRGQEHLQNCWKHISLQKALGLPTPVYGHIPLIMNTDGSKMSKRQKTGQVNTADFRQDGYVSEVLLNYLALLGWNPGGDVEHFDLDFMIKNFDIKDINKGSARFDYKKLLNFNSRYLSELDVWKQFTGKLMDEYGQTYYPDKVEQIGLAGKAGSFVALNHGRIKTLKDAFESCDWLYKDIQYDKEMAGKILKSEADIHSLMLASDALKAIDDWDAENISKALNNLATELNLAIGKIAQPIRFAITGSNVSPPIDKTLEVLGKDVAMKRLINCIHEFDYIRPLVIEV